MDNRKRFRLHFGPYHSPRVRYGATVKDAARGNVRVVGLSDARIPWPHTTYKTPVLFGGLIRAVRKESRPAVAHWFGVSLWRVQQWRTALGVEQNNAGTLRLRREHGKQPWFKRAQQLAWAKARDPVRREKIAAAKRGKSRPSGVMEALRKANLGRKLSADHRRKMSEAHKRRGTRPPKAGRAWTDWEDKLCRTLPIREVMKRTGRTQSAVASRRRTLKVPDGRTRSERRRQQ